MLTHLVMIVLASLCGVTDAALAQVASAAGIDRLVEAYPDFLAKSDKPNTVVWKDGTEMVYDDGIPKTGFDDLLQKPCLKDQVAMRYPPGWPLSPPGVNDDPGRVRYDPLFRKMYGASAEDVRSKLKAVPWPTAGKGKTVQFTSVNGAAGSLERVGAEISALAAEVQAYVAKPAGTFNWRPIAETDRLSMHGYGAAIDFELPKPLRHYWMWESKKGAAPIAYPKQVLADAKLGQIVQAFEKHGFIWGGKWYHFDTIHFEYRPELLPRINPAQRD